MHFAEFHIGSRIALLGSLSITCHPLFAVFCFGLGMIGATVTAF